ncbi:YHYH domain-containing protein [Paenibacillus macquariensis]|uniref:YHYH domain-containing protein n=1 Tax=Paenibacillus macquariensis TaxID=948756 RepID=UPI000B04206B|nr:YHYH domain-containing protein [Paenibacillus macquariensis]MEC0092393.1 YHYH domain-containing protein [Paenibacillus macquariensis]
MKKIIVLSIALTVLLGISSSAYAHSGRTDKNGGHNCSAKSKQKGLCTGYHYHNKKK